MQLAEVNTELLQILTSDQAWFYSIVPKEFNRDGYVFYINEDSDVTVVRDELEMLFNRKVELITQPADKINSVLSRYYRRSQTKKDKGIVFENKHDDFLKRLLMEAKGIGCSDIHIERYEKKCRVRYRLDGKLIEKYILKNDEYPALVNKVKVEANLDIAEKRLPQDGRIYFNLNSEKFDLRVSVLPTLYGEKVVLRILSKDTTSINISELGFDNQQLKLYEEGIKRPHGIILISGPTGSGKTTTLYATLKVLNNEDTNILTIEDPIEYTLEGVNQVQLKESIGLTFPHALRTFLRQDPDIIMLGEIRDQETAKMAIRAALTGHLVLSTIHTNSAWGTISRLLDMGIPEYMVSNTLNISVAQRLVRILCNDCKKQKPFDQSLFPSSYSPPRTIETHYVSIGCNKCYFSGYKGRKALFEVLPIDGNVQVKIREMNKGMNNNYKEKKYNRLMDYGFDLFYKGKTTIEEIYPLLITEENE